MSRIVRHLILGGEGMWRAWERHAGEPVESRRREEPERVPRFLTESPIRSLASRMTKLRPRRARW